MDAFLYLNVNIGRNTVLYPEAFIYLNTNIQQGFGVVAFPYRDVTAPRRLEFDGDDNFIL